MEDEATTPTSAERNRDSEDAKTGASGNGNHEDKLSGKCWECGSTHHYSMPVSRDDLFQVQVKGPHEGQMSEQLPGGGMGRTASRDQQRGLSAIAEWHKGNGYAALAAKV